MAVTLKDIAQEASVTEQAVSRALRGHSNISPATIQKVRKIANDLGYRPNLHARSLRSQSSKAVGFIFPDITYSYAQDIAEGARSQLSQFNYLSLIGLASWNAEQETREAELLLGYQVEALICQPMVESETIYNKVVSMGIPLVFVGNGLDIPGTEWVGLDGYNAGRKVMDHLLELGHRRIAFVGTDHTHKSLALSPIAVAYRDALKKAGLGENEAWIRYSETGNKKSVEKIADELIALPDRPTAIFCVSDTIAYSVMSCLMSHNLKIPQDVSIAGIGDMPSSALEMISLTTVSEDARQIGNLAAQSVLTLIKDPGRTLLRRKIHGDLVQRRSTAPPPEY